MFFRGGSNIDTPLVVTFLFSGPYTKIYFSPHHGWPQDGLGGFVKGRCAELGHMPDPGYLTIPQETKKGIYKVHTKNIIS